MMSSSASFVAVPFDADMVAILIVVVTALDADADDANDAVDLYGCVCICGSVFEIQNKAVTKTEVRDQTECP